MPVVKKKIQKKSIPVTAVKKEKAKTAAPVKKPIRKTRTVAQKIRAVKKIAPPERAPIVRTVEPIIYGEKVSIYHTVSGSLNRLMMIVSASVFVLALILTGIMSFAAETPCEPTGTDVTAYEKPCGPLGDGVGAAAQAVYGDSAKSAYEVVALLIEIFLGILGIVFVGLIIYAGFLWMTDQGKEDQVKKAQQVLQHSIVGLLVVLAAFAITSWILNKIGIAVG